MTYLVSGANGDISISLAKILKEIRPDARIIGISPDGEWPALSVFDSVYPIPYANHSEYMSSLKRLLKQEKVKLFLPTSESELRFLSGLKNLSSEIDCVVVMNAGNVLEIFLDKYSTSQWLSSINLPAPRTLMLSEATAADFPLVIKPRQSAGSKNIVLIRDTESLDAYQQFYSQLNRIDDFIAQEYIDDAEGEYTAGIIKLDGEVRVVTFKRKLQGGLTGFAELVEPKRYQTFYADFSDYLSNDFFLNIQFRIKNSKPFIFEVNPRFSSTVRMRHKIGFTDFKWTLDFIESSKLPELFEPKIPTQICRTTDELVIV